MRNEEKFFQKNDIFLMRNEEKFFSKKRHFFNDFKN